MQIRIYYEDTDCGNVVYYANYLKYMERSRTEFLRERGVDLAVYHADGFLFTVSEAHLNYRAPARYNDLLDVTSAILEITSATINFVTEIRRAGESGLLVTGEVRVACIRANDRPTRIPEKMKKALEE
jgi:acyl-CoA thioester hydrolase